jgi:tartrate/fumarate subfamily iron-sulfur-dependent hydro-lyase beta chain
MPMPEPVAITLPRDAGMLRALPAGTAVSLSGPVFTARDSTHVRIIAELERDGALPYGLVGQVLFYAGPTPASAGRPVGAVGPTTSRRMDAWTPRLLAAGIAGTLGKGPRGDEVRRACAEYGAVYLTAVGGAAALLGRHVTAAETVAYAELGTEALRRLELVEFPAWIAIDAQGRDLFAEARRAWSSGGALR